MTGKTMQIRIAVCSEAQRRVIGRLSPEARRDILVQAAISKMRATITQYEQEHAAKEQG